MELIDIIKEFMLTPAIWVTLFIFLSFNLIVAKIGKKEIK